MAHVAPHLYEIPMNLMSDPPRKHILQLADNADQGAVESRVSTSILRIGQWTYYSYSGFLLRWASNNEQLSALASVARILRSPDSVRNLRCARGHADLFRVMATLA
jgi:hypothetical protein